LKPQTYQDAQDRRIAAIVGEILGEQSLATIVDNLRFGVALARDNLSVAVALLPHLDGFSDQLSQAGPDTHADLELLAESLPALAQHVKRAVEVLDGWPESNMCLALARQGRNE
jgi:hypothetical protein